MQSISILAIVIALYSSIAKAEEISVGNLDLCLPNSGNGETERLCLTPDGVMEPAVEQSSSEEAVFQFHYDNGLLRAPGTNFCLGPSVPVLNSGYHKPYELLPQECPSDEDDHELDTAREDASWPLTHSRHMRFVITQEGRVQSLAEIQHPWTFGDEVSRRPYCLAMRKANTDEFERAYLVPCDEYVFETKEFDVYGTYSGSFLIPLHCVWASQEVVDIAFQIGLPTESVQTDADSNFVEITTLWPVDGKSLEEMLVDVIPLESSLTGGILSLEPFGSNLNGFGYQLDGKLTATLRTTEGDQEDGVVLSEASFWVSETVDRSVARAPTSSYFMYLYIVGLFVACFLLSVLLEKLCLRRTRSEGDLSNDGKTVCMSTEEEEEDDDFPLEDDNVEEGFGVIHICASKEEAGTSSDTDTDIDESRTSTMAEIPREDSE